MPVLPGNGVVAAMASLCVSPIKATVMRVVKLDTCGVPVTGDASAVVVQDGFISISVSPQYEDGDEFIQRLANGSLCINQKDPDSFKRVDLEMTWCVLDPDAIVMIAGERLLTDGDPVTGTGVVFGEGEALSHFSLEVWQPVSGAGACTASGDAQYVYWAFMNVGNGRVGDFTFENGIFNFVMSASTFSASPVWGTGPGTGGPWIGQPVIAGDHYLYNVTTEPPPVSSCGAALLT